MRLLNVRELTLQTFAPTNVPRYIVASHRWFTDEEVTFKDITKRRNTHKSGYKKVLGYAAYIKRNIKDVDWLWIDTCCVDQGSSQEVTEAVNSMFQWYSNAELCIAYLVDVVTAHDLCETRRSSWFRRGWTLQELLVPRNIVFVTNNWQVIGHKGDGGSGSSGAGVMTGPPLETIIAEITGIPERILHNGWRSNVVNAEEIFRWMAHRETTKEEDLSYCLFGLFDVSLPLIYGEREGRARERLIAEISLAGATRRMRLAGGVSPGISAGVQNTDTGIGGRDTYGPNEGSNGPQFNAEIVSYIGNAGQDKRGDQKPPTAIEVEPVKAWLNAVSSKMIREQCLACRTDGTCRWFLDRTEIATWLQPPRKGSTLWLHASPGFGKSVTSAALAEHLEQECSTEVLTCFCSATNDTLREPTNILRTCLTQAILRRRDFFQIVADSKQRSDASVATEAELVQLISTTAKLEPGFVIMVDGYDECLEFESDYHRRCGRNRAEFLRKLCEMVSCTPSRLIIVSRDEKDIRSALHRSDDLAANTGSVEYHIQAGDVQDDIRRFSEERVQALESLRYRPRDLQIEITQSLTNGSGGMFLWVRLQSEQLARARNAASVRKQIGRTPQGLDEFYERDWQRIQSSESSERDRSLLILRWVTFAVRPLSPRELFEAIAIEYHDSDYVLSEDSLPDRLITDEVIKFELLDPCKPFLELQGYNNGDSDDNAHVIQVAHFSMKTFLLEKFGGKSASAYINVQDEILARCCIGYLAAGLPWVNIEVPDEGLRSHPLLMYTVQNWMTHLDVSQASHQKALQATEVLFNPNNPHWTKWRDLFEEITEVQDVAYIAKDLDLKFVAEGIGSRCYYAALFGLRDALMQNIIATSGEASTLGGRYGTPLQAACVKGHVGLVSILLSAGANINARSGLWGSALNAAAVVGNTEIISLLLKETIDLRLTDGFGRDALYLAARENHAGVVRLLLEKEINLKTANKDGWTPIYAASVKGHTEVVKLLLERDVDIETADKGGRTLIYAASFNGHAAVVKLLLEKDVDIETADKAGWTPINVASAQGYIEVVKLLLEKDVDIETTDKDGRTPIFAASVNGHAAVVKLLLEKDVDIETADKAGWTLINSASVNGHIEVVKLLLEKDVDLEAANKDGWTPVNAASNKGHIEVVKLLLEKNVDLETADNTGQTPLYSATVNGHDKVVDVLLKAGVVCTAQNKDGWTPINVASSRGDIEVVKLLLEKNVDLETANNTGQTPLFSATVSGHDKVVDVLLKAGAVCTAQSKDGWTPINVASSRGDIEVVKLILEKNVDLETASNTGQTPLFSATVSGHDKVVDVLLKAGAVCTAQSKDGWTPINVASSRGGIEVVKLLLLEKNVDLETAENTGQTPLYSAAVKGHDKVVDMLLKAGAVCTVQTEDGWTPINIASKKGHLEVVKLLLLEKNVNIETAEDTGQTPLYSAAVNNHDKVVDVLLKAGAACTVQNKGGWTPISAASDNGYIDVVKLLLDAGADPNDQGGGYFKPLQAASGKGHDKVVQMLLDVGVDINTQESLYGSALQAASYGGREKVVQMLLNAGAAVNAQGGRYGNALHAASYGGHEKVVQMLLDAGASVKAEEGHSSALHLAAHGGYDGVIRLLLEHQGHATCRDQHGWTASTLASTYGHSQVLTILSCGSEIETTAKAKLEATPSALACLDDCPEVTISPDGLTIATVNLSSSWLRKRFQFRADHPIPSYQDMFYFEATIVNCGYENMVGIGVCEKYSEWNGMPGWYAGSWAYHGDDGNFFNEKGRGKEYGPTYTTGDVVGCGGDKVAGTLFFTKNGQHLGEATTGIRARLFPVIGVGSNNVRVSVNFGLLPFKYREASLTVP